MTFEEYQARAARTINKDLSGGQMERHALHEIAGECGEIHSLYQKELQGHLMDYDALRMEIGDLLWGIAELCTVHGWNLGDVAEENIAKLYRRYPEGFDPERSRNRGETV